MCREKRGPELLEAFSFPIEDLNRMPAKKLELLEGRLNKQLEEEEAKSLDDESLDIDLESFLLDEEAYI